MSVEEYDVVVLGTGAARLTAALRAAADGASVGLFEKADTVGGTTAWSGGVAWLPLNRHERELDVPDDRETVLTYLDSLSHGLIDPELAAVFVDTASQRISGWLVEAVARRDRRSRTLRARMPARSPISPPR